MQFLPESATILASKLIGVTITKFWPQVLHWNKVVLREADGFFFFQTHRRNDRSRAVTGV